MATNPRERSHIKICINTLLKGYKQKGMNYSEVHKKHRLPIVDAANHIRTCNHCQYRNPFNARGYCQTPCLRYYTFFLSGENCRDWAHLVIEKCVLGKPQLSV